MDHNRNKTSYNCNIKEMRTKLQLRESGKYKEGDKTKIHIFVSNPSKPVGEEESKERREEEEEKEEEGGGEEEDQGMFVLESNVFWIPRALVWRLVAPLV